MQYLNLNRTMKKLLTFILLLFSLTVFSQEIKTVYTETKQERKERKQEERKNWRKLPDDQKRLLREQERSTRIYHDTRLNRRENIVGGFIITFIVLMGTTDVVNHINNDN